MSHHDHAALSSSDDHARESSSSTPTRLATLDGFVGVSASPDGVQIDQLEPLTELRVRTCNSTYEIFVVEPHRSRVVVRGGQHFPIPTRATLEGSTFGGSCLKLGWIGAGFCMEIHSDDVVIVTSPVCGVRLGQVSPAGRRDAGYELCCRIGQGVTP